MRKTESSRVATPRASGGGASVPACAGSSPWRSASASPPASRTNCRREVLPLVSRPLFMDGCVTTIDLFENNNNIKRKNTKVNAGISISFTFVFSYRRIKKNHLVNGTGRRSVPSLKPTLIAIWLPFAAATGAIAAGADESAAADTAAADTAAASSPTPVAVGAKDQGPA